MNPLSIILSACSLSILVLGIFLRRLTDSRSIFLNCLFGSLFFLFAAYHSVSKVKPELVLVMPFLALMLFLGRTIGTLWRVRKESELIPLARLLSAATAVCFVGGAAAWFMR
ncbi:MAG: hypothetical protein WCK17_11220 [Verrucomicrobiota bacterium]|jgi:hypothetical protein